MSSGIRALIISIVLFLLWGTILTGPFRYFAKAFRDFFAWGLMKTHAPAALSGFAMVLLLLMVTIVLLILSSKRYAGYIAGLCSVLSMAYYLFVCLKNQSFDTLAFPIAAGLALALLFLIFQSDGAGLWLADAFIYSIPVLMFIELILSPVIVAAHAASGGLSAFFKVPKISAATEIGNFLQIPMLVWSVFLFALLLIPTVYFSRNRRTG